MPRLIHGLVALTLSVAGTALATPADDFRRGGAAELITSAANLHITGPLGYDARQPAMSNGSICLTKTAGSNDLSIDFAPLGLPIVVPFTGTAVDSATMRFTTNVAVNQCVTLGGASRFVKTVSGTLTARLSPYATPQAGMCATDFAQNLQISGGGETDLNNQLHITVDSGCGGITFPADVIVHDIILDGRSGQYEPERPIEVASLSLDRGYICPAPERTLRVSGSLRLRSAAPSSGASFTLSSSDASVTVSPTALSLPAGRTAAGFLTTIPAHYLGTFSVSAVEAHGATGSHTVTVTNGFGGLCRIPFEIYELNRPLWGDCLACNFRGRIRGGRPPAELSQWKDTKVFMSGASAAGSVGYSLEDGVLQGFITDSGKQDGMQVVPDMQFAEMNDLGQAVGTYVDPQTSKHVPVVMEKGSMKALASPTGQGEATSINNASEVGGWVLDAKGVQQAAFWSSKGVLTVLHPKGAQSSEVVSISEDGMAAGVAILSTGTKISFVYDAQKQVSSELEIPKGYDGVELVGATREGLRAGHLLSGAQREAFIDYGAGPQLVSTLLRKGLTVDHLISMSDDGGLLAMGTSKGVTRYLLLGVK